MKKKFDKKISSNFSITKSIFFTATCPDLISLVLQRTDTLNLRGNDRNVCERMQLPTARQTSVVPSSQV